MVSEQRKIALAFLQSFETLDLEANLALRADDCRHDMVPASMGFTPSQTNEQFAEHFRNVSDLMSAFPVTAKEIFEHEGANQVTVWATSNAIFREDVKDDDLSVDWTYHGEYMFLFFFDSSGTKIRRIIEFIDSRKVAKVMSLMQRARSKHELGLKSS